MSMNVGGGEGGVKSDINVTPLVDVMLVLLIIMMIVAPLLQQGVNLQLPNAANSIEKPETQEQTQLAITRDGGYWVNGIEVPFNDMRRQVDEVMSQSTEQVLVIKADQQVEYGLVMDAFDELRISGIEEIALITERRQPAGGE